jgi:hypothetical protein
MAVLNQGTITDSPELDDWLTTASSNNMATNSYSYSTSNNYTINTQSPYYTINTGAASASVWTTAGYNGSSSGGKLNVDGKDADVVINGKSLSEFMTKMEDRLAILVPELEKLEKFAALKKAYDHYKLMEKLCHEEPIDNDR